MIPRNHVEAYRDRYEQYAKHADIVKHLSLYVGIIVHMTLEERKKLKERMRERLAGLEREIASMEESAKPVEPDNAIGRLTRLEAMGAQGVSDAALRSMKAELSRLQYALKKVDEPDFGECTICGGDIPLKRLMVKPDAVTCVPCTERGER